MPDFTTMSAEEFLAWKAGTKLNEDELSQPQYLEPHNRPTPAPAQENVRPAAEVWGSTEYDFVCPSGAQCRMRKLMPEKLIETGILDRITTLPGYAEELVQQAEGAPPKKADDLVPDKEELKSITAILDILVPLAVVEPRVFPTPGPGEDREVGRIYVDSIELMDRIAIMERAVQGVKKLEPFRA